MKRTTVQILEPDQRQYKKDQRIEPQYLHTAPANLIGRLTDMIRRVLLRDTLCIAFVQLRKLPGCSRHPKLLTIHDIVQCLVLSRPVMVQVNSKNIPHGSSPLSSLWKTIYSFILQYTFFCHLSIVFRLFR